jgi:hypothetical protein
MNNWIIIVVLIQLEEKPTLFSVKMELLIYNIFNVVVSRYIIF